VVAQDLRFKDDSQSAEDVFNEMSEEELLKLHGNFVKAGGGKLPKPEEVKAVEAGERVKKESTHEITKQLLLEKMSVSEIAKSRKMVESTIWGHVEDLINEEQLLRTEIAHLTPSNWEQTWPQIEKAIQEVGDEKLKPIFEYLKEKYDYDQVRLGRIYWRLTTK